MGGTCAVSTGGYAIHYPMTTRNKRRPPPIQRGVRNRESNGRYAVEVRCDVCGKPVRGGYATDDEVCEGGDGPGFRLCSRKRCIAQYEGKPVAERRAIYSRCTGIPAIETLMAVLSGLASVPCFCGSRLPQVQGIRELPSCPVCNAI
jgi:hypothetical protein